MSDTGTDLMLLWLKKRIILLSFEMYQFVADSLPAMVVEEEVSSLFVADVCVSPLTCLFL